MHETENDPTFIMRNMRDYFLSILCTCLKNVFNYIHANLKF